MDLESVSSVTYSSSSVETEDPPFGLCCESEYLCVSLGRSVSVSAVLFYKWL